MKAILNGAPISFKKMRVIAKVARGEKVEKAVAHLNLMPKKGGKILAKLISSAAANAETNQGQKREDLMVDTIIVNKGAILKRFMPVSRGRAHNYAKQTSNINITLKADVSEKVAKKTTTETSGEVNEKPETKKTVAKKTTVKKTAAKKEVKADSEK